MNKDDRRWWSIGDCEILTHDNVDDAVEEFLDSQMSGLVDKEITVFEYKCKVIPGDYLVDQILELALEQLDEEFGDPEGDYCMEHTVMMKKAAFEFSRKMSELYTPWQCEMTGDFKTISVKQWKLDNE